MECVGERGEEVKEGRMRRQRKKELGIAGSNGKGKEKTTRPWKGEPAGKT